MESRSPVILTALRTGKGQAWDSTSQPGSGELRAAGKELHFPRLLSQKASRKETQTLCSEAFGRFRDVSPSLCQPFRVGPGHVSLSFSPLSTEQFTGLGQLAIGPRYPLATCPSAGISDAHHHTPLTWVLEMRHRSLCLRSKHSADGALSPAPALVSETPVVREGCECP